MLRGDEPREFIGMLFYKISELEHDASTGERRGPGPFGESLGGCSRGRIDFGSSTHANLSRELAGRRIENVTEAAVVMRVKLRARDEMHDDIHAVFFARKNRGRKRQSI